MSREEKSLNAGNRFVSVETWVPTVWVSSVLAHFYSKGCLLDELGLEPASCPSFLYLLTQPMKSFISFILFYFTLKANLFLEGSNLVNC